METLSREQMMLHDLQKLELSEGWKLIVDVMQKERSALVDNVMSIENARDNKTYSLNDMDRLMIQWIDNVIISPTALKKKLEPVIKTDTPI